MPFARLVKVELRKTYDTRAGIWLLGITAFLAAAVMVVALIVVLVQDEPIKLDDFVGIANFISGFLLPVLGIMLVTSEWSQRTAMVTFTLEAHRGRIVAAKLVAGLLLALIVSLIATVSAFIVNGIYAVVHGGGDWHFGFLELLGLPAHPGDRDADRVRLRDAAAQHGGGDRRLLRLQLPGPDDLRHRRGVPRLVQGRAALGRLHAGADSR